MHDCHTDKKAWQDTHAVLEYIIIRFPLNRKTGNKKCRQIQRLSYICRHLTSIRRIQIPIVAGMFARTNVSYLL